MAENHPSPFQQGPDYDYRTTPFSTEIKPSIEDEFDRTTSPSRVESPGTDENGYPSFDLHAPLLGEGHQHFKASSSNSLAPKPDIPATERSDIGEADLFIRESNSNPTSSNVSLSPVSSADVSHVAPIMSRKSAAKPATAKSMKPSNMSNPSLSDAFRASHTAPTRPPTFIEALPPSIYMRDIATNPYTSKIFTPPSIPLVPKSSTAKPQQGTKRKVSEPHATSQTGPLFRMEFSESTEPDFVMHFPEPPPSMAKTKPKVVATSSVPADHPKSQGGKASAARSSPAMTRTENTARTNLPDKAASQPSATAGIGDPQNFEGTMHHRIARCKGLLEKAGAPASLENTDLYRKVNAQIGGQVDQLSAKLRDGDGGTVAQVLAHLNEWDKDLDVEAVLKKYIMYSKMLEVVEGAAREGKSKE